MLMKSRMWVGLTALGLVASFVPSTIAADPNVSGTWTWTMTRNDQEIKQTLKVKQDGEKLTGEIENPRGKTEISDGKVKDGVVSFNVIRERDGNKMEFRYTGKVDSDGDTLKLKLEFEREGEKQSHDIEAKRVTEKG